MPLFRFAVGAALEAEDGRIFTGCNVENASFGLTICAERAAVAAAVAPGARRFRRLVDRGRAEPPASPCGACRQVLAEFGGDLVMDAVGPTGSRQWTIRRAAAGPFSLDMERMPDERIRGPPRRRITEAR